MRQSLKNKIATSESSKLPQMHKLDSYQDMQAATSEKKLQDTQGPFNESDHQKPYMGGDYQFVEYSPGPKSDYDSPKWPKFPATPPLLPYKPGKGGKQDFCKALWDKLVPASMRGGFRVTAQVKELMIEYQKYCPMDYVYGVCCNKSQKIRYSSPVDSGNVQKLVLDPEFPGCIYNWEAEKGKIHIDVYIAPVNNTPNEITDTVTLTIWPAQGSLGNICKKFPIKVRPINCSGEKITPTNLTMATSATQLLSIAGKVAGKAYSWVIVSGGGSLDQATGDTVHLTAPAANANCLNNPVIQLKVGTSICDTITIYVNNTPGLVTAFEVATCIPVSNYFRKSITGYYCDGTERGTMLHGTYSTIGECIASNSGNIYCGCNLIGIGTHDCRGVNCNNLMANGCCPAQLR
jgi:hypothetical protein